MDLKTFIAESLTQIAEGIKEAQKSDSGAIFSPLLKFNKDGQPEIAYNMKDLQPQMVAFDVAVTVTESSEKKGGLSVAMASLFGFGGEVDSSSENAAISRIRFEIPVVWPAVDVKNKS